VRPADQRCPIVIILLRGDRTYPSGLVMVTKKASATKVTEALTVSYQDQGLRFCVPALPFRQTTQQL
jgi:hypothetical protein